MIAFFLMLSLALIGFWCGWRARHCQVFRLCEDLWIDRLFMPAISFLAWFGFAVYAVGRGWL